ncbi:MAG TPA: NAD-glutamate dehydrogenase, partial [Rudaea sp.]|nr:NAD-glutamate dehydrogenase [Rudaea sp.]
MNTHADAATPVVDLVLQQLKDRLGAAQCAQAQKFARHFFKRVSSDDLASRSVEDWTAMMLSLHDFVRVRKPGTPNVRVYMPSAAANGWDSNHTSIDVITDDAPFLVDSASIAIAHAGLLLHMVVHPVYGIERDAGGHVLDIAAEGSNGRAESLMHIEIDPIVEPADRARM